jgi:hypothetical protein
LLSCRIWSEKCFTRCILTQLKSNLSTRCCAIADAIWIVFSLTRRRFAAAETLFQAGSLSYSSCLSKVDCFFKVSETCIVDLLA